MNLSHKNAQRMWANNMELAYLDVNQQMEHWVFLVQIK